MQCQLRMSYSIAERVKEKVKIGKDKEIEVTNRYCANKDSIVNAEDDGCEKFSPAKFFWCRGWDSWVELKVCQHRINLDKFRTCPCSLGVEASTIQILPKKQLVVRRPKKQLVIRRK